MKRGFLKILMYFFFGLILLTASKCDDEDNPPPVPILYEGRGAFMSCYIDGEYWETKGGNGANDNVDVYYDNWNHALSISGKDDDIYTIVHIFISKNLDTLGLNNLLTNGNNTDILLRDNIRYNLDVEDSFENIVNISNFDSKNNCIEGEFQFKAISRDLSDTVIVDRGYFSDYFRTN